MYFQNTQFRLFSVKILQKMVRLQSKTLHRGHFNRGSEFFNLSIQTLSFGLLLTKFIFVAKQLHRAHMT